ncbi:MAG: hypothetical protein GY696_39960 [Gammaproteobacteria bacterium]|nr:hypothetical protein [Gammaproteobacteria bacterium]
MLREGQSDCQMRRWQKKTNWQPLTLRVQQLAIRVIQGGNDQGQPDASGADQGYDDMVAAFESVHASAGFC